MSVGLRCPRLHVCLDPTCRTAECIAGTCKTVVQTCDGPCTRNNPTCPDLANCRCVIPEGQTDGTCSTDQTCAGVCNTTDLLCPDVADCECVICRPSPPAPVSPGTI